MSPKEIKKVLRAALESLSADCSLGYLAVTSKPELPVRDRLAWYFHQNHPELIAAREYYIKNNSKRVDLALLRPSIGPVALVEFKAMIAPDVLSGNAGRKLMNDLMDELKAVNHLRNIQRLGVMLMVHIENIQSMEPSVLNSRAFKYLVKFRRPRSTTPGALEEAVENAKEFFKQANADINYVCTDLGQVWGVNVKMVSFLVGP